MNDAAFARQINLRTARNLVNQASVHLCVGGVEEALTMCRLAVGFLDRAEQTNAIIVPFPKVRRDGR